MDRIEKIKTHIIEHKETYIACGVGILVGVAGMAIVSKHVNIDFKQKNVQVAIGNKINQRIINFVERSTPSKPVHLIGTDLYFDSISDAARKTGHSISRISKQINGHIPDVGGDVFEILEKAV